MNTPTIEHAQTVQLWVKDKGSSLELIVDGVQTIVIKDIDTLMVRFPQPEGYEGELPKIPFAASVKRIDSDSDWDAPKRKDGP